MGNFTESLARNACLPERVRLRIWQALLRSALYLAGRDLAFNTPRWEIIRDVDPPDGISTAIERDVRCGQSTVRMQTTPFPFKVVSRFIFRPNLPSGPNAFFAAPNPKKCTFRNTVLKGQWELPFLFIVVLALKSVAF